MILIYSVNAIIITNISQRQLLLQSGLLYFTLFEQIQQKMQSKEEHQQEFQEIKDEVLTYALSQQLSPMLALAVKDGKMGNSEKYRLELLERNAQGEIQDFNWKEINKSIKKVQSSIGRIIPVGSVTFRSNFECGNIFAVRLAGQNTYEIELERETNSNRVSSWFDFIVQGAKGETTFIIKGFTKRSSLYSEGMKICYREVGEHSKWRRGGTKICYTNSLVDEGEKDSYELRFSYFFKSNERTCIQFAYCFPYGLKRLYSMIYQIKKEIGYQVLGKTFNGLNMPLLTIGDTQSKKVIVLSARVHPGETVSSFIIEGFLKQLVSNSDYARLLRENYLFKIVPMLNPDGVVKGNYRFSAYGCDLNRKWKSCRENAQPEICFMKDLLKSLHKEKKVVMYIDIHGHSRKKNVFFYGCSDNSEEHSERNSKIRQFPYLMQRINDAFRYQSCTFNVEKDKEGTARITVWKDLKIDYVYTLQSSFCGPQYGANYLESDYEKVGKKLCEGIAIFFADSIVKDKGEVVMSDQTIERITKMREKVILEFQSNPQLLKVGKEIDVGSESQPQVGQIAEKDRNPQNGLPKAEFLLPKHKRQPRPKKLSFPTSFFSSPSYRQQKPLVLHSQVSLGDKLAQAQVKKSQTDLDMLQSQDLSHQKFQRYAHQPQKSNYNPLSKLQPQAIKPNGLYHRNIRVYSLTKNSQRESQKKNTVALCFNDPQQQKDIIKVNLMRGRQGVQYRRVKKMMEQAMTKQHLQTQEEGSTYVKQLQGNQLYMDRFQRTARKCAVTPRFYPSSVQKNRRTSVDVYSKKHQKQESPRRFVNHQLNLRCKGTEISNPSPIIRLQK